VIGHWAHHWLYEDFWVLVWPNVGAVPLCAAASLIGVYCFRRPLERAWQRARTHLNAPLRAEIAELRSVAERAHRIAADTHKALTGTDHPDAPSDVTGERMYRKGDSPGSASPEQVRAQNSAAEIADQAREDGR